MKNFLKALTLADGNEQSFQDGYDMWSWFVARKGILPERDESKSTNTDSPVVQRRRLLAYTQETMVQLHPGPLGFDMPRYANRQSGSVF